MVTRFSSSCGILKTLCNLVGTPHMQRRIHIRPSPLRMPLEARSFWQKHLKVLLSKVNPGFARPSNKSTICRPSTTFMVIKLVFKWTILWLTSWAKWKIKGIKVKSLTTTMILTTWFQRQTRNVSIPIEVAWPILIQPLLISPMLLVHKQCTIDLSRRLELILIYSRRKERLRMDRAESSVVT